MGSRDHYFDAAGLPRLHADALAQAVGGRRGHPPRGSLRSRSLSIITRMWRRLLGRPGRPSDPARRSGESASRTPPSALCMRFPRRAIGREIGGAKTQSHTTSA
jgi:hypothetical protein